MKSCCGTAYSVIAPFGVIRPIPFVPLEMVNHRLPSGPAVISEGDPFAPPSARAGSANSVMTGAHDGKLTPTLPLPPLATTGSICSVTFVVTPAATVAPTGLLIQGGIADAAWAHATP